MSKKALVFGASGNSGQYLSRRLIENGWSVVGVSRSIPKFQLTGYKHISLDLRTDNFTDLPRDVELIINLAGLQPSVMKKEIAQSIESQNRAYVETNILANLRIIEFARTTEAETFLFASTHRELENLWSNGVRIASNSPVSINPKGDHAMFAITKSTASQVNNFVAANGGPRVFNLRLPMMLLIPESPYYLVEGLPKIMPFLDLIRKAASGEPIEIWGDPDLRRDYVHIENLFQLSLLAHKSTISGGTFVIGTGEGVKTKDFVQSIAKKFSTGKLSEITENSKIKTYKSAMYDISREHELLGYKPILLRQCLEMLKQEIDEKDRFADWGWKK